MNRLNPNEETTPEALARSIVNTLRQAGFQALLVGGCVRDLLIGRVPKDWDVATDAVPSELIRLFPKANLVGARFGVILVSEEHTTVEVATFRSDAEYRDGRRPESVSYEKDPREDAIRRDFTINGLFFDTERELVIDFVGGRADLDSGIVRAIGDPDLRFNEDHLRLLRAIRFAARFGFQIDEQTWESICRLAPAVCTVSMERVRDELTRILIEGGARRGFELLDRSGLLIAILPELAAMKEVPQPPQFHPEGDVWTHTLLLLEKLNKPSVALAWGALLHDIGKPPTFEIVDRIRFNGHAERGAEMTQQILSRLRFPGDEANQITQLVANHMRFMHAMEMRESTLRRFVRQARFDEHLELNRIDCLSSNGHLETYNYVRKRLDELSEEQLRPTLLLNGRDLIELGYRPGPQFSEILRAIEDAQLEGVVASREGALRLVAERFPRSDER